MGLLNCSLLHWHTFGGGHKIFEKDFLQNSFLTISMLVHVFFKAYVLTKKSAISNLF